MLSGSTLCNKDVRPITLQPLYDVIVALVIFGLDYRLMYDWVTIPSVVPVVYIVGKGLTYNLWTCVGDYSTHLRSTGITVWLGQWSKGYHNY